VSSPLPITGFGLECGKPIKKRKKSNNLLLGNLYDFFMVKKSEVL